MYYLVQWECENKEAFHNKVYHKRITDIKKQVKFHKEEIGDNTFRRILIETLKSK